MAIENSENAQTHRQATTSGCQDEVVLVGSSSFIPSRLATDKKTITSQPHDDSFVHKIIVKIVMNVGYQMRSQASLALSFGIEHVDNFVPLYRKL